MTRFDAVESQAPIATLDTVQLTGAKLQADYLTSFTPGTDAKFIPIADKQVAQAQVQIPDDAAGDQSTQQKDPIKALVQADPKELPASLQGLQGLASHFDKADDKAKALAEVRGPVETTIADADKNAAAARKDFIDGMKALEPQIKTVNAELTAAAKPWQEAAKNVAAEDQKRVGAELTLLVDEKTKPALKQAIEEDLKTYPNLTQAFEAITTAQRDGQPILEKQQALKAAAGEAIEAQIDSRLIYADMLIQGGDTAGAKRVNGEQMGLQMGMTIEQIRALKEKTATPGDKN